jgi:GNAT superfamily N-acetyltransferase
MTVQIRTAKAGDLAAVRDFARRVVAPHYTSIGLLPEFGESMLANYWESDGQEAAVNQQRVFLATDDDDDVVGVAEYGAYEGEPVLWKLYIAESHRGTVIGQALIDRFIESVAPDTESLLIEHVAENVATGEIYENLGFPGAWIDQGGDAPGGTTVWRRKRLNPTSPIRRHQ